MNPLVVIDHDSIGLADPKLPNQLAESITARKGVWQLGVCIGNHFDIKKHGTRNMRRQIFCMGLAW